MRYFALLLLWLLSLLFGCGGRSAKKPKQDLPWFPNTDNPALQVMEIPLDSGYTIQTFLVAPERKEIYVLARTRMVMSKKHILEERWRTDYQLLHLDAQGQVLQRRELANCQDSDPAFLWLEGNALFFFANDKGRLFDLASLEPVEEIPYYAQYVFPSSKNLQELFPEEQLELYAPARAQALKKSSFTRILELPKAGGTVLLLENTNKSRSLWTILDETDLEQLRALYPLIQPKLNDNWKYNPETGLYQVGDKDIFLETTAKVSMGTQLDYPNYKSRSAIQYEMSLHGEKVRFATNDRSRKPLYVQFSQNDYLSATGTEVWLGYNGSLYRLTLTQDE